MYLVKNMLNYTADVLHTSLPLRADRMGFFASSERHSIRGIVRMYVIHPYRCVPIGWDSSQAQKDIVYGDCEDVCNTSLPLCADRMGFFAGSEGHSVRGIVRMYVIHPYHCVLIE